MKCISSRFRRARKKPIRSRLQVLRALGDSARDTRQWTAAAGYYAEYLRLRPDDFSIWVQNGHALKESQRFDEAHAAYTTAEALRPDDADLILNQAHLEKHLGHLKAAAKLYLRSYNLDRNRAAAEALGSSFIFSQLEPRDVQGAVGYRLVGVIERLSGFTLEGWAVHPESPQAPAELTLSVDGVDLVSFSTQAPREDLAHIGFDQNCAGFRIDLSRFAELGAGTRVALRLSATDEALLCSPFTAEVDDLVASWLRRNEDIDREEIDSIARSFRTTGRISFVMPIFNPRPEWLKESIDSVIAQWCPNWELVCVDDGSDEITKEILKYYSHSDGRIRIINIEKNSGISVATNIGIRAATSEYIAFMDQDDYLEPEATLRLIDAAGKESDLIYSDEVVTSDNINDIRFFSCRPVFSYDYYLSHPYFIHLVCVRRQTALNVGGLNESIAISADVDFILRVIEVATSVTHIPALLYRWRTHYSSAGHKMAEAASQTTKEAIQAHLRRVGCSARIEPLPAYNAQRIMYTYNELAVIRFNEGDYPPKESEPDDQYYLFANAGIDDCDLASMKGLCARRDVGIVGATIVSSDNRIVHSGLLLFPDGTIARSHWGERLCDEGRRAGYNSSLISTRDYSAVSGDFLMMRADIYRAAGGLDRNIPYSTAVLELCLRVRSLGYKVLVDGMTVAKLKTEFEDLPDYSKKIALSAVRAEEMLADGDPFYSPLLSDEGDHSPYALDNLRAAARTVKICLPNRERGPCEAGQRPTA